MTKMITCKGVQKVSGPKDITMSCKALQIVQEEITKVRSEWAVEMSMDSDSQGDAVTMVTDALESRITQRMEKELSSTKNTEQMNHRLNIELYLAAKEIQPGELWCAVGYYWFGAGCHKDRSFATDEQWYLLLLATNRRQDARYHRQSLRV